MIQNICHRAPGGAVYLPWMNDRQKEAELLRGTECALQKFGVPTHFKGYKYLVTAIMLVADDPNCLKFKTMKLYRDVAEIHGETYQCVDKDIRTLIEKTFDKYDNSQLYDYFGDLIKERNGKATNTDFIRRLADDVRADVMSHSLDENRKRLLKELGLESEIPDQEQIYAAQVE